LTSLAGEEERNLAACRSLVAEENVVTYFERVCSRQLDREVIEIVRD
jgi:hypothetical protein